MKIITGIAATIDIDNIDTDMIIPKQFLKTITKKGLGKVLFYEKRYHADGSENNDFILNQNPYKNTKILIVGDNFGCGSSREHAPWAIKDFGIDVIIAPSFADIFYNNCLENQIIPIILDKTDIKTISEYQKEITVDIENQSILADEIYSFTINAAAKDKIIKNLDSIGEVLLKSDKIKEFESGLLF